MRIEHYVDGERRSLTGGRTSPVYLPADGSVQHEVMLASADDVRLVVDAAAKAAPEWAESSLAQRTKILFRYKELLEAHADELAGIISAEHGKVRSDAMGELRRGIDVVDFACGIAHLQKGEFSENVSRDVDTYSLRAPLGVVAGITPFNFPAMVPMWMYPIAIATGNTFVLKPSERDPSASVRLAELFSEAGLPNGVFNVVHGDKEAVDALLEDSRVRAVSFVGSTPIARSIFQRAAEQGKRVQALGGAKNHMIVLPDADLDVAADAAVSAGYGSAGERCMAISVVVAVGEIADALREKIVARIADLRIGDGRNDDVDMGPLVTAAHRDRVMGYIETAAADGAEVVVDGRAHPLVGDSGGFYLGATLLDHVPLASRAYREEIFGPVLSMVRSSSLGEAIALVNANPYANGVAIFTEDGAAARRFQHKIDAGMIGLNVAIPVPVSFYSFGGNKESLFGDLHVYGPDGVRFYTRGKVVTARWAAPERAGVDFGFPQSR